MHSRSQLEGCRRAGRTTLCGASEAELGVWSLSQEQQNLCRFYSGGSYLIWGVLQIPPLDVFGEKVSGAREEVDLLAHIMAASRRGTGGLGVMSVHWR